MCDPEFAPFPHLAPLSLHDQLIQEILHPVFKKRLHALAFQCDPFVVEAGKVLALLNRNSMSHVFTGDRFTLSKFQLRSVKNVLGAGIKLDGHLV